MLFSWSYLFFVIVWMLLNYNNLISYQNKNINKCDF